jgi:hypothetical protein
LAFSSEFRYNVLEEKVLDISVEHTVPIFRVEVMRTDGRWFCVGNGK